MSAITSTDIEPTIEPAQKGSFFVESGAVMQRLRSSISDMLKAVPNRVRTTRDLQKAFGVDVKLCWQVLKLSGPGDALSLAPFVPTPGPMRRFLTAAQSAGIDAQLVERIRTAYGEFEEQITIHAGDRTTFESMATGAAGVHEGANEDLQKAAIRLRKAAFQTASHYAGVQLDTYLGLSFLCPSAQPNLLDAANLRVKMGIRRLRSTTDLIVDQTKHVNSDTRIEIQQDTLRRGNFDNDAAAKFGAPILPRFSSNPLPQFKTFTDTDGRTSITIVSDNVGQTSAVDLVFGQTIFNAPYTSLSMIGGKRMGFGTSIDIATPTVVVILDKLVHRPTFPQLDTLFTVDWVNNAAFPTSSENPATLPFSERLVKLEAGVDGARTHEVPKYVEMVEFVCDQCNWKIEDFDVYRVRLEYPLHHTRLWTKFAAANQG